MSKKFIVYGHKSPLHTHFHIHFGYFKAFKNMGFDTYWVDSRSDLSQFDFENTIFLTEDQAHEGIPLDKKAKYILHHCKEEKYIDAGCKYIKLENFLKASLVTIYSHFQKIDSYCVFDEKTNRLFQPWATDLLPSEFPARAIDFDRNLSNINYVGTIWNENEYEFQVFNQSCTLYGKRFRNFVSSGAPWRAGEGHYTKLIRRASYKFARKFFDFAIDDHQARKLIESSYIAPDIRNSHHRQVGYIPCRVFKNISYGKIPATNSSYIRDFFCEPLPFAADAADLFDVNVKAHGDGYRDKFNDIMLDVRNNHTYLNRAQNILSVL